MKIMQSLTLLVSIIASFAIVGCASNEVGNVSDSPFEASVESNLRKYTPGKIDVYAGDTLYQYRGTKNDSGLYLLTDLNFLGKSFAKSVISNPYSRFDLSHFEKVKKRLEIPSHAKPLFYDSIRMKTYYDYSIDEDGYGAAMRMVGVIDAFENKQELGVLEGSPMGVLYDAKRNRLVIFSYYGPLVLIDTITLKCVEDVAYDYIVDFVGFTSNGDLLFTERWEPFGLIRIDSIGKSSPFLNGDNEKGVLGYLQSLPEDTHWFIDGKKIYVSGFGGLAPVPEYMAGYEVVRMTQR